MPFLVIAARRQSQHLAYAFVISFSAIQVPDHTVALHYSDNLKTFRENPAFGNSFGYNPKVSNKRYSMKSFRILILLSVLLAANAFAEWSVFLLFGQSNMAGMAATPSAEDKVTNDKVKVLAYTNCSGLSRTADQWYTASPPLHNCSEGVGPGDYFARTLLDSGYTDTIALVPVAVSGASIDLFRKNFSFSSSFLTPPFQNNKAGAGYDWVKGRLTKALQKGKLKGILYHQGESDCSGWGGTPSTWLTRVQEVVRDLKTDLSLGDVPFVIGELSQDENSFKTMNPLIAQIPGLITNSTVVSSQGLARGSDNVHFTTAAQREFGKRYAKAFLTLSPIVKMSSSAQSSSSVMVASSSAGSTRIQKVSITSDFQLLVSGSVLNLKNTPLFSAYSISDAQGKVLLQGVTDKPEMEIQMDRAGTYFVQVGSTTRLVILR